MADQNVIRRLDTIISILRLAHQREIDDARSRLLRDGVSAVVLEATATDFIGAGDLKTKIAKTTGQSEKTVQRRIAELVAMGVLEKRPTGAAAYRSTGIL